jgi:hypothetical protein
MFTLPENVVVVSFDDFSLNAKMFNYITNVAGLKPYILGHSKNNRGYHYYFRADPTDKLKKVSAKPANCGAVIDLYCGRADTDMAERIKKDGFQRE